MNKKQWNTLAIGSNLLAILFMKISLLWKNSGGCLANEVDMINIYSCVRGEIFAPFPYIFFIAGLIFIICGWLEK